MNAKNNSIISKTAYSNTIILIKEGVQAEVAIIKGFENAISEISLTDTEKYVLRNKHFNKCKKFIR